MHHQSPGLNILAGAFDIILMDIQMPGIDGMEASRRIRASNSYGASTPVIALTANVLNHQRETYLAAGMDAMVGKPISPPVLIREIVSLLDPKEHSLPTGAKRAMAE
jgi:CheY-like chemotaxis protein